MVKYFISEFEQIKITEILASLKKIEEQEQLSELEKGYYIYHQLGEIYSENPDFVLTDVNTQYEKKKDLYEKETTEDGKAVCAHMSKAFAEALLQIGIEAYIIRVNKENPITHIDVIFKTKSGEVYFVNLISDILRIQTGMRVHNFGKPYKILESTMRKEENMWYLKRVEMEYGQLSEVSKEKIEEMDKKFGFNKKGIYTEDVFKILKDEMEDQKKIEDFFGTSRPDELIEKKMDFAMNIIGIANKHGKGKIGYREGIKYYLQLQKIMLTKEEVDKYIEFFSGYRIENYQKVPETIIILLKENENKYYRYYETEKKFIKVENAKEIKKLDIKYDVENKELLRRETKRVNDIIDNLERRIKVDNTR